MNSKSFFLACINALILLIIGSGFSPIDQALNTWSPPQQIPGYDNDSEAPYLISDQNNTVHAFSSQWIGGNDQRKAIFYNQYTPDQGWTSPVDILLSPLKEEARLVGVFLDRNNIVHLIFMGGDETGANIYYSKAPLVNAGKATAWSDPKPIGKEAFIFESAAIVGDGEDKLVMIYSGNREGPGVYMVSSTDSGDSWSDPKPIFLSADSQEWPSGLDMNLGDSGWVHAVWGIVDVGGQGRGILYSRSKIGSNEWSTPIELETTGIGLGTKFPRVIENQGTVFVLYYSNGPLIMRRSDDQGQSWTAPAIPFQQVGLNGAVSFAVDSNQDLHLFWGQRLSGSPDIHGMWHSIWRGENWSLPEAIISGPRISDEFGDKSFDPTSARAVTNQGNKLLVTWVTDPGLKGNGVWYSTERISAPELPIDPLATQSPSMPISTPIAEHITPTNIPTQAAETETHLMTEGLNVPEEKPSFPILLGVTPVILLIGVFVVYQIRHRSQ